MTRRERLEAKADRLREWAAKREARASARDRGEGAHAMTDHVCQDCEKLRTHHLDVRKMPLGHLGVWHVAGWNTLTALCALTAEQLRAAKEAPIVVRDPRMKTIMLRNSFHGTETRVRVPDWVEDAWGYLQSRALDGERKDRARRARVARTLCPSYRQGCTCGPVRP